MSEVTVTEAFWWQGVDGLYYWHSRGGNHEIIAQSEGYVDRDDALAACQASIPEGVEIKERDG